MNIEQLLPRKKEIMPFRGIRFIGFDLDGTLFQEPLRSHSEVFGNSISHLFGIDKQKAAAFAKQTSGIPTQQQLEDFNILVTLPNLRQLVADNIDEEFFNQPVQLFPEVLNVLKQLKKQGIRLFISSSRPTDNIQSLLQHHPELAQLIDFSVGTDPKDSTLKKGEGHFKKAADHFGISFEELVKQAIFIGDTPSDIKAGASIGVRTIGRTGTKTQEELINSGATIVLNDLSSLPALLDSERIIPSENIYASEFVSVKGGEKLWLQNHTSSPSMN